MSSACNTENENNDPTSVYNRVSSVSPAKCNDKKYMLVSGSSNNSNRNINIDFATTQECYCIKTNVSFDALNGDISDLIDYVNKREPPNDDDNGVELGYDSLREQINTQNQTQGDNFTEHLCKSNEHKPSAVNISFETPVEESDDNEEVITFNETAAEIIDIESGEDSDCSFQSIFTDLVESNIFADRPEGFPRIRVRRDLMPKTPGEEEALPGISIVTGSPRYRCDVLDMEEFKKECKNIDLRSVLKKNNYGFELHHIRRSVSKIRSSKENVIEFLSEKLESLTSRVERDLHNKKKRKEFYKAEAEAIIVVLVGDGSIKKLENLDETRAKEVILAKEKKWCSTCLLEARFQCCWGAHYCSIKCQVVQYTA